MLPLLLLLYATVYGGDGVGGGGGDGDGGARVRQYGLTTELVHREFKFYMDRFGVKPEAKRLT